MDIQAMEENLLRITETWKAYNIDFEESGKTCIFYLTLLNFTKKLLYWRDNFTLLEETITYLEGIYSVCSHYSLAVDIAFIVGYSVFYWNPMWHFLYAMYCGTRT